MFPRAVPQLGGKRPVFSLNPVPGALDAMVSSELLETARQIGNGMSSPDRTLVITSSARTLTTQERMQLGDGRADAADLLKRGAAVQPRRTMCSTWARVAKEAGTVVSAVMLGAVAGSGLFPFAREDYEAVVRAGGKGAEASLRGFAKAFDIVAAPRAKAAIVEQVLARRSACGARRWLPRRRRPAMAAVQLPARPSRDVRPRPCAACWSTRARTTPTSTCSACSRCCDAEREADPQGAHGYATTREMARWLALWMAFDDIVRVADLKSRASRWQRVQGEVKAGEDDLLKVYDHFKPGVPEFAALLPPAAGRAGWCAGTASASRKGKQPWALPLKIGTHSVFGMLALRTWPR